MMENGSQKCSSTTAKPVEGEPEKMKEMAVPVSNDLGRKAVT